MAKELTELEKHYNKFNEEKGSDAAMDRWNTALPWNISIAI